MKRMFLGLLLLFAVGIFACGPQTNDNTTVPNANAGPSSSPKGSPTLGNNGDLSNFGEVVVTITIADDEEKNPYIASVLPESADLTGGLRVQWLVDNNSEQPAGQNSTIVIGPFSGKTNPSDNKPFGVDAWANMFTLDLLKEGKQSREISERENFQAGELGYTYVVTLKAEDGRELARFKKVPEIIISGMVLKPEASPKASPKASPTAKPKT